MSRQAHADGARMAARKEERRRLYRSQPRHLRSNRPAASDSGHRSLRTFYWSNVKGRWATLGNMGRMKLMLESAHEIIENDPMFRISRRR
jgi:hypothetical protein